MIYHQLFIPFSSAIYFISASELSPEKPSVWACIRRQIFGAPQMNRVFKQLLPSFDPESNMSRLESLDDKILHMIFQNFVNYYATMRLVSKKFRRAFDDMIFEMCWMKFPGFTKETFSHWNGGGPANVNEEYLKYQLIPLERVLSSHIANLIHYYENSKSKLDLTANDQLRLNAFQLIQSIMPMFKLTSLELANVFLKLRIVEWNDIYDLLLNDRPFSIRDCWGYGLKMVARQMATSQPHIFIDSFVPSYDGLLNAIRKRNYHYSRFIIRFLRARSYRFINDKDNEIFVNNVIAGLVLAKYWDLLEEMYPICKRYVFSLHVLYLAYYGHAGGLRAFKDLAKRKSHKLAYLAASRGHLEFLQELDAMGLLGRSCYLSIHAAASHGHTECLDFLVSRLGSKYLSYPNLARKSKNLEMLRETLFSKLAPYYKPLVNG